MTDESGGRVTVMLLEVAKAITAKAAAAVAPFDLRQVAALLAVGQLGDPSQQEIGDHAGLDRTTIGKVVSDLEGRGLVNRQVGVTDHRRKGVTLTDAGRVALSQIDQAFARCDDDFLQPIDKHAREGLRLILIRLLPYGDVK